MPRPPPVGTYSSTVQEGKREGEKSILSKHSTSGGKERKRNAVPQSLVGSIPGKKRKKRKREYARNLQSYDPSGLLSGEEKKGGREKRKEMPCGTPVIQFLPRPTHKKKKTGSQISDKMLPFSQIERGGERGREKKVGVGIESCSPACGGKKGKGEAHKDLREKKKKKRQFHRQRAHRGGGGNSLGLNNGEGRKEKKKKNYDARVGASGERGVEGP